jgi:hypothetical protein
VRHTLLLEQLGRNPGWFGEDIVVLGCLRVWPWRRSGSLRLEWRNKRDKCIGLKPLGNTPGKSNGREFAFGFIQLGSMDLAVKARFESPSLSFPGLA